MDFRYRYNKEADFELTMPLDGLIAGKLRTGRVIYGRVSLSSDKITWYTDPFQVAPEWWAGGVPPRPKDGEETITEHPQSTQPQRSVPEILGAAAATFADRNPAYGDAYKRFGPLLGAVFPGGIRVDAEDAEGLNRLGLLVMCCVKLSRYSQSFDTGGHADSAHDLCVYAAMLEELTVKR